MPLQSRLLSPETTLDDILLGSAQVAARLRNLCANVGPETDVSQFSFRVRAKSLSSVHGKVRHRRNRLSTPEYSFRDITDYVGLRIVTLYDDQLTRAIDYIISVIAAAQSTEEPLFAPGNMWSLFHDAQVSSRIEDQFNPATTPRRDVYHACFAHLRRRIQGEALRKERSAILHACELHPVERSRYSSAHMTFWASAYLANGRVINIPVEFQLRTALEDVWAEIDHDLSYKTRNAFLWSEQYAAHLEQARTISEHLKSELDRQLPAIEGLREAAKAAELIANDYFGDREMSPDHEARAQYKHISLCAALLAMIADGRPTAEVTTELADYGAAMLAVGELKEHEAAEEYLEWIRRWSAFAAAHPAREGEERKKQTNFLIELEVARLETLVARTGYVIRDDTLVDIGTLTEKERLHAYLSLYKNLCGFVDNRDMYIKPIAMIYMWKAQIASEFDAELEKENLDLAVLHLEIDPTLPYWSVYRVLIPSYVAVSLFTEAHDRRSLIDESGIVTEDMKTLSARLVAKLLDAIRYAVKAFREHMDERKRKVEKRGDIGLTSSQYAPLREAALIVKIHRELCQYAIFKSIALDEELGQGIERAERYAREEVRKYRAGDETSELCSFTEEDAEELLAIFNEGE